MAASAFSKEQLDQIALMLTQTLENEKKKEPPVVAPQTFYQPRPAVRPPYQHNQQQCYHRRPTYNTQSYTPRGYSPNSNYNTSYNSHRTASSMLQIRLMITYVESATIFWGQVLSPDLIDTTRKLEESLANICPKLPPTNKVSKTAIYACQWSDSTWYRCISCGPTDPEGNVEMLFVDFGNREKRNVSELVWINSQNVLTIPFNACPFRFPNLLSDSEQLTEAIKCFNTTDVLSGIVTRHPKPDEYTDIFLCRPLGDETDNGCHTYNSLVVEKKFAHVNDHCPANKPPPTNYYLKHLQSKIQHLTMCLKEKQAENEQLYVMQQDSGIIPAQHSNGHIASLNGSFTSPHKFEHPSSPQQKFEHPPSPQQKFYRDSEEKAVVETAALVDTNTSETQTNSAPSDHPDTHKVQVLIDSLFADLQHYSTLVKELDISDDLPNIMQSYNKLHSCSVGEELVVKKLGVEEATQNLTAAQSSIKSCCDKKLLEDYIQARDEALQTIIDRITDYKGCLSDCQLEDTADTLKEVLQTLFGEETVPCIGSYTTPEEALQCITERDKLRASAIDEHRSKCTDTMFTLASKFNSCVRLTEHVSDKTSEREPEQVEKDQEYVSDIALAMSVVRSELREFEDFCKSDQTARQPLLSSFRSLIYSKAKRDLLNIEPYIRSVDELDAVSRKAVAALENKPDMQALNSVKGKLKKAKKEVKYAQIEVEEDESEEEGSSAEKVRECMHNLHSLYKEEEEELAKLADYASTTHPELLIEHPQLRNMIDDDSFVKCSWDIAEFVVPDTAASINSKKQNVYIGFYGDVDPVYFVEYKLQSVDGSLEEEAVALIRGKLEGCFAVFVDKKRLGAYGATETPPE